MNICIICNREYIYNKKKGHTKKKCNSCSVNERRFRIKEKAINYMGRKCQLCGYSKCFYALVFHHINPNNKDFQISGSHCRNWTKIQIELDKCILVCSNCHMEIHSDLNHL